MRETQYKDLTQTKECKKFIWLSFMLILLTAICLCLTTFIYAATQQNMGSHVHMHFEPQADYLNYTNNTDGTLTVTGLMSGLTEQPTNIKIPSKYNGATVTKIAASAFEGNTTMTSLTIPETITSIGAYAFRNTSNLTEINYNVTNKSTTVVLYAAYPFYLAGKSSDGITVNFGPDVVKVPSNLFRTNSQSYAPNITVVNFLGNNVKEIGSKAFYCCKNLTSISIPEGVTRIGEESFYDCDGLQSVTIPETITQIDHYAFAYSDGIKEINYNVTSDSESIVVKPRSSYGVGLMTEPFRGVGDSETGVTVNFGPNVTRVTDYLFYNSTNWGTAKPKIAKVNFLGNKVKTIGSVVFGACEGLNMTIPSSVTNIANFFGNTSISNYNTYEGGLYLGNDDNPYMVFMKLRSSSSPTYNIHPNTKIIYSEAFTGCTALTGSLTIPEGVISIGAKAFYNCSKLESISISDSVTSIGNYAFDGCIGLTNVSIPNGVTSIGSGAFYNCSGLTNISIPDSVTSIGSGAFYNCNGLAYNTFDNATYLGDNDNMYKILIKATSSSITSCNIHPNTKIIYPEAFKYCRELTNITIPEGIIGIGWYSFQECKGLTSITIPSSVENINNLAFYDCSGLTSIKVDSANKYFTSRDTKGNECNIILSTQGDTKGALITGCNNSTIPDDGSVTSIGDRAFEKCKGLTSITIPEGVISIGNGAFQYCSELKSVIIPNSVTIIGNSAFGDCSGLKEVIISKDSKLTSIEVFAFRYCSGLTSITIPSSVTCMGDGVFGTCRKLKEVIIEEGVTDIADSTFEDCYELTTIIIPEGVINIEEDAFNDCNLTSITIPSTVESIADNAFGGCDELTSIKVDSKNTNYSSRDKDGEECNCLIRLSNGTLLTGCKNTTIPYDGSVTSIGSRAFAGCSGLTTITIPSGITTISDSAFQSCSELKSVIIPNSVTSIGNYAFYNCTGLTSITIPSKVKSIGNSAFYKCGGLQEVIIDSEYAYKNATSTTTCGYLLGYIGKNEKVKVLKSIVDNTAKNSYLNNTSNFTTSTETIVKDGVSVEYVVFTHV